MDNTQNGNYPVGLFLDPQGLANGTSNGMWFVVRGGLGTATYPAILEASRAMLGDPPTKECYDGSSKPRFLGSPLRGKHA